MDYRFLIQNRKYIDDEVRLIEPASGHIRVCAIYANCYETAMSSLGFHFLYESLNSYPQLSVDRCYLPDEKSMPLVLSKYLSSFETATPLVNFNILAFSVSYESDFINVLRILRLARIPFNKKERLEYGYPLIVCGGPAVMQNMIPVYEVFDILAAGAGEVCIDKLISTYIKLFESKKNPSEINRDVIEVLSAENCFFVPSVSAGMNSNKIVKCAFAAPARFAKTVILTPHTEFKMRALIETVRGCVRRCKFCMVGNCYGHFKHNPSEDVLQYVNLISRHTNKIGLLGPAVSAHPELLSLYSALGGRGLDVSMSSVYLNEISGELINLLSDNEQRNITVAIESASEDVRRAAAKKLFDAEIFDNVNKVMSYGIKGFKVYFILGLYDYFGLDGEKEAEDTICFISKLYEKMLEKRKDARLKVSVNPLVIKPRTPLYDMERAAGGFDEFYSSVRYIDELELRYKKIIKNLKSFNIEFSEKNFADSRLLKLINECSINLFDFFDDFFYNEIRSSKAVIKIMNSIPDAFSAGCVKQKLFFIEF